MNKVILMGRLTRDPEVRYSQAAEPLAIARYLRTDSIIRTLASNLVMSRQQILSPVLHLAETESLLRSI